MSYRHINVIAICESRFLECFQRDIGPQVSEVRIVDLKNSLCFSRLYNRLVHLMFYNFFYRVLRSYALKINDSACKTCCSISEQVSTVEDRNVLGSFSAQTVYGFVDLANRFDSDQTFYMCQRTIIRCHNVVSVHCFRYAGTTACSDSRINYRYIDRSLRPELKTLIQTVTCTPCIILRQFMGSVHDLQLTVYRLYHSVHGADRTLFVSKICLKN